MASPALAPEPGSPITDAERQRVAEWIASLGKTPMDVSRDVVASNFGYTQRRARTILEDLRRGPVAAARVVPAQPGESHDREGDKWAISIPKTRIHTLEQLVEYCEINTAEWDVERFVVNKWEVGAKDNEGSIKVEPLFQVKAWLKKKIAVVSARTEIDAMLLELRSKSTSFPAIKRADTPTGNMLELSFPDLHIGKLAWGQETGWEDYDSKIAEQVFRDAFSAMLQRTSAYRYDRVCLVVGNDLLNADNSDNTTTKGTPQSCDTRHPKSFQIARRVNVWAIEEARKIAPVDVVMVSGNHDTNAVFYLGEVLDARFHNCKDVTVDNRPLLRKLYTFGSVAITFTHGDKGKRKDYPLMMATESRKEWGNAQFCEIHTGDKHQVRLEEQYGVRVRILPSLCASDAWHSGAGYVGNVRSAEAYMWNRDEGLIGTAHYNITATSEANRGARRGAA